MNSRNKIDVICSLIEGIQITAIQVNLFLMPINTWKVMCILSHTLHYFQRQNIDPLLLDMKERLNPFVPSVLNRVRLTKIVI